MVSERALFSLQKSITYSLHNYQPSQVVVEETEKGILIRKLDLEKV